MKFLFNPFAVGRSYLSRALLIFGVICIQALLLKGIYPCGLKKCCAKKVTPIDNVPQVCAPHRRLAKKCPSPSKSPPPAINNKQCLQYALAQYSVYRYKSNSLLPKFFWMSPFSLIFWSHLPSPKKGSDANLPSPKLVSWGPIQPSDLVQTYFLVIIKLG